MSTQNLDNLFFKTAVHQCNDLVVITDSEAKIIYVNPAFEKHTGHKLARIKGNNISVVKSGEHTKEFYKKLWQEIKKGRPISRVFINKKKNGELYYENKTITPIKNSKGKIEYYLSTSKDFTKEVKLQKEIINQKDFTQTVIQNTDALIVGLDKNARIVLFNKACEKLMGYKLAEVIGKNAIDLFVPRSTRKEMKEVFHCISNNEGKLGGFESKWVTKSNQEILIKWSNTLINDYKNEGLLVLSTGIDITKERESDRKLKLLNIQLDDKVKERTIEVERLNYTLTLNNKLLGKINTNLPAIIYLLNIKTKTVKLLNVNINENLHLTEKPNSEIAYKDFMRYFSSPNSKSVSMNTFCNEKLNKEFTLKINKNEVKVQNRSVIFEYDKKKDPIEYLGFITDVSSIKTIQHRLEESQKIAHIGTWEWNIVTNDLYWSDEIYRIFEIDPDKFQPSYPKFLDVIHQNDRKLIEYAVLHSIENKEIYEITHRLEPTPGKIKYVTEKGYCIYDTVGKPLRMIGTVRDITETEYIRMRLEESQRLAKIGNWEWEIGTDNVYWSNEMYNIFDVDKAEFQATFENLLTLVHPDDKELVSVTPFKARENKTNYEVEYRIIDSKNNIKHLKGRGYTEYTSDGSAIRMHGTVQDITKEKILKDKLQSSFITLENSINAIFTSDINGRIEYANKAAVCMWGYSDLKEMLAERPLIFEYWHPDELESIYNSVAELNKTGKYETTSYFKAIKKNREVIFVRFNSALIRDDRGIPIAMTGSFFDITEEIQNKREIEKHENKLKLLFGNIDEVVYGNEIIDGQLLTGNNFFLSGKAKQIIGFNGGDLRNDPDLWYKSLHPDDIQTVVDTANQAIISKTSVTRLYRLKHKIKNDFIWLEDKITPEFNEKGQLKYFYGSARDVTERIKKDELLRASEEKYRLLSDNNQDLISLRDPKGNAIFISNSVESLLGYKVEEYKKLNLFDLIHPDDRDSIRTSTFDPLTARKEKGIAESRVKHKNGQYRWMNSVTSPVYNEKGEIIHIIGSTRDVTLRKELELSLKESEEKYRLLSDNNNDLITLRDAKGKALFVSKSVKTLLGYTPEEYSQFDLHELLHPDDKRRVKDLIQDPNSKNKTNGYGEARLRHKDGHYIWMQAVTNSVYNENGDLIRVIGSSRDITERKNLELSLSANELKYRSLYENALVGIFRTNIATQKPVEVNEVCVKLFGYDSKEDFMTNFVASERYSNIEIRNEVLQEIKEKLEIQNKEVYFKRKDGTFFWSNMSVKFLPEENILEGVVVDVTQSKAFEEQLKRNLSEKDVLLKEIHHRVKNNLQIISSLLKLQLNKITDPKIKEPILESRERIRAIALIHEKLYLSEDVSTINFSEYLVNLTKPMHSLNKEKHITVNYDMVDYLTEINIAIPLGLACYEIISNAFKHAFNTKQSATLNLSISKIDSGHQILISDTGIGFDIDQIDTKLSLGWNLIENLTKQAKGSISIRSKIGEGSEFQIELKNA